MSALGRAARTRKKAILFLLVVLLVGGVVGGGYAYGFQQWKAAEAAMEERRLEDAREHLKVCLFLWPRSEAVHLLAARAARWDGDFPGAEAQLNKCKSISHEASDAVQLEFLLLRVQTGQVDEVAPALINLVEQKRPESATILETLAQAYMHRMSYREAYACLTRWIEDDPKAFKPLHWRGWVLERLDNAKLALADYKQALKLNPQLTDVRLRVADMLMEDNRLLEALPDLEGLYKEHPELPEVQGTLGHARLLEGKTDEARILLESAAAALPKDAPLLVRLAKLEMQEDRPTAAEKWLRRLLELDPYDPEAAYTLASCLQQQGRQKEAEAALAQHQKAKTLVERTNHLLTDQAKHPSEDPNVLAEIGSNLLRIKQDRQGLFWLHEALKRNPAHAPSHKVLTEYYEKKGDHKTAEVYRKHFASLGGKFDER